MKIVRKQITVGEVANGYRNSDELGVVGYGGLLNIRPAYQREFVYKDKQRDAVIKTIRKGYPLNVMYWSKNEDGTFEVLDGQQRTISFCEFVGQGAMRYTFKDGDEVIGFNGMTDAERDEILNYKLDIFICEGTDKERLDWFRTINIAGEKLTDQELLNVNYTGSWLSDAKSKFSKTGCVAYKIGSPFVKGSPIRQEYLETAIDWISEGKIAEYMSAHRNEPHALELWSYFQNVINWIEATFNTNKYYRKEMLGLDWGRLYREYGKNIYNPETLEARVKALMEDDEVTEKKGIYEYVLSGESERIARKLSKRTFSNADKRTIYERQNGICPKCGKHYEFSEMEGDHVIPWWRGGKTNIDNLQMLCKECNSGKAGKPE